MAKHMCEAEEQLGSFKIRSSKVGLVQEVERVAKCIHCNHITCAGFEEVVQLNHFAGCLLHSKEQFSHMPFHDGLETADAGCREETVDSVASAAVQVVAYGGHHGLGSFRSRVS